MTKKEIFKASEDSLDAIIDELETIGMEGLIEAVTGGPKVMAAYRMVADTVGMLRIACSTLATAKEIIGD